MLVFYSYTIRVLACITIIYWFWLSVIWYLVTWTLNAERKHERSQPREKVKTLVSKSSSDPPDTTAAHPAHREPPNEKRTGPREHWPASQSLEPLAQRCTASQRSLRFENLRRAPFQPEPVFKPRGVSTFKQYPAAFPPPCFVVVFLHDCLRPSSCTSKPNRDLVRT